jgi:hypothetical protein
MIKSHPAWGGMTFFMQHSGFHFPHSVFKLLTGLAMAAFKATDG